MLNTERADKIYKMITDVIYGDGEADVMFDFWGVTEEEYTEFMECAFKYIDLNR